MESKVWEIDENMKEHFKELGLITGKEFIEFDIYKTLEHKINSLYDAENKTHHQFANDDLFVRLHPEQQVKLETSLTGGWMTLYAILFFRLATRLFSLLT
jgi:hypothetical protein